MLHPDEVAALAAWYSGCVADENSNLLVGPGMPEGPAEQGVGDRGGLHLQRYCTSGRCKYVSMVRRDSRTQYRTSMKRPSSTFVLTTCSLPFQPTPPFQ